MPPWMMNRPYRLPETGHADQTRRKSGWPQYSGYCLSWNVRSAWPDHPGHAYRNPGRRYQHTLHNQSRRGWMDANRHFPLPPMTFPATNAAVDPAWLPHVAIYQKKPHQTCQYQTVRRPHKSHSCLARNVWHAVTHLPPNDLQALVSPGPDLT